MEVLLLSPSQALPNIFDIATMHNVTFCDFSEQLICGVFTSLPTCGLKLYGYK